jgi:uncharacterized membrane protein YphA (DoxX/SURF4 family)
MSTTVSSAAVASAVHVPTTTAASSRPRAIGRYAVIAGRILLGLCFFVFGLAYFIHFMPEPEGPQPAGALAFGGALFQTGYMFPLIKGTEVACGALLLVNRFVPLALVVLAPIIVNIVAFHAFLEPSGLVVALLIAAVELGLAWAYRGAFRGVVAPRATPGA